MTPSAERYNTNSWNKKSIRNPTKLNPHGKEFTQKKRWTKDNPFCHIIPQTHACDPKDSWPPAPHSCCMQSIPPTQGPDQNP